MSSSLELKCKHAPHINSYWPMGSPPPTAIAGQEGVKHIVRCLQLPSVIHWQQVTAYTHLGQH